MLFKLKQQVSRHQFTSSNRLPNRRARHFLVNYLLRFRRSKSLVFRATLGLTTWTLSRAYHGENRIANRFGCFLSGRARGTSQRFSVSRTKTRYLASTGKLFGARKAGW